MIFQILNYQKHLYVYMKVLSQIHTNLWVHTLKAFVMQFAIRFFKICFFGDCLCFVFLLVPGNFCQLMRIWLDRKMRPLKINWGVFSIFAVSLIMPNYENVRSFTSLETIQVQNDFYLFLQLRYWQKVEFCTVFR